MAYEFDRSLKFVLKWEGGWANVPGDHGGPTACGITIGRFRTTKYDNDGDGDVDVEDLKLITPEQVEQIYRDDYWAGAAPKPEAFAWPLCLAMFDVAVNSGQKRATKCLQTALGLTSDGVAGQKTLAAVAAITDPKAVALKVCDAREAFLKAIGVGNQAKFLKGWLRRVADLRREILT